MDSSNKIVPGTLITITGSGFRPAKITEIWWEDPIGNDFRMRQAGEYVEVLTDARGAFEIQVNMPFNVLPPSAEGRQTHQVEARQIFVEGSHHPAEPLSPA